MEKNLSDDDVTANYRKKLLFRSWHRGTREMDLLLGRFADHCLGSFSVDELRDYEQLLNLNDPDLYNWVSGRDSHPANDVNPMLARLIAFYAHGDDP